MTKRSELPTTILKVMLAMGIGALISASYGGVGSDLRQLLQQTSQVLPAAGVTPFRNCAAARAAGAAPVYRGDPNYAAWLDRDNDGVGCE